MKRSKTQFKRLTELTDRIRDGREPVNCLILATEWEVSQKTVQRDIDYLRDQLHAPLIDKKSLFGNPGGPRPTRAENMPKPV